MIRLVEHVSTLPTEQRREMLATRLLAIARLAPASRFALIGAMRAGPERLPDDRRGAMVATQMDAMSTLLTQGEHRALMAGMDGMERDALRAPYGPPRGLARMPMALFRDLVEKALTDTLAEAGVARGRVVVAGEVRLEYERGSDAVVANDSIRWSVLVSLATDGLLALKIRHGVSFQHHDGPSAAAISEELDDQ